jgi:hypothetical protein
MATLADTFVSHWDDQQRVAPNMLLGAHLPAIQNVLAFVDHEPEARTLKQEMLRIFRTSNWLLDPVLFQEFVQGLGEAQFWMIAKARGVNLEPIPKKKLQNTPDFRLVGCGDNAPSFEVKTLSVARGTQNLNQINEGSFQAQISLSDQVNQGKKIAMAVQEAAPHGVIADGKNSTTIIRNLIDKTTNNIKPGQYLNAPTCLVLNLLLIDAHFNGNASLRPVAFGYPEAWSARSGAFWSLAFGKVGHLVLGIPEFEGKPGVEGTLLRDGILEANPEIQALLLIVHRWNKEPTCFGLKRESDDDRWVAELGGLADAFHTLVGDNWNDERDTNGWCLLEH